MKISIIKKEAEKIRDIFSAVSKIKSTLPVCYQIKIDAGEEGVTFTMFSLHNVEMFITYKSGCIDVAEQGSCLVNYDWFISKIIKFGISNCFFDPATLKFDIWCDNIDTGCVGELIVDFPKTNRSDGSFNTVVERIDIKPFINASFIKGKDTYDKIFQRDVFVNLKNAGTSKIFGSSLYTAYSEDVVADCDFECAVDREVFDLMYKNVSDNIFSFVANGQQLGFVSRDVSYYFGKSRNGHNFSIDKVLPDSYDIQFTISSECFRKIKGDITMNITEHKVTVNGSDCVISRIKNNLNEPSIVFTLSNDKDRGMVDRFLKVLPKKETELLVRIKDKKMVIEYEHVTMLFSNQKLSY